LPVEGQIIFHKHVVRSNLVCHMNVRLSLTEMLCALLQLINWRMKGSSLQFLLCLLIFQLFTKDPHETSFIWQTERTPPSSLIFFSCYVLLWF